MKPAYQQLQNEYIGMLRSVMPVVIDWWNERCPYPPTEPVPSEARTDFHRRWPAGPVGHPRILAVFREFFLKVEALNERTTIEDDAMLLPETETWGQDVEPPGRSQVRPIDLLVNDLENVAPDLYEVMQGLHFVPIGTDPDGRTS
jgi:hypothetical protein